MSRSETPSIAESISLVALSFSCTADSAASARSNAFAAASSTWLARFSALDALSAAAAI